MPRPLCVLLPEIGVFSETFVRWAVHDLLPDGTVVISDPPPAGESVRHGEAWDTADCPTLVFQPRPGDPAPSSEHLAAAGAFLAEHQVEVVLVEFLDFADRWFDALLERGVRVWLRGHGVDVSARLTEQRWRQAYRRYAKAHGVMVPSTVAARSLTRIGLPAEKVHVVRYSVDLPPWRARVGGSPNRQADEVRCVAVGRLVAKKAPLATLESFRRAAAQDDRLVLEFVGDGPMMSDVCRFLDDHSLHDRVRLHGRLPHSPTLALIRAADVLLHHAVTSADGDTEGQPLVVLEAMAAGIAVVSTDHAGIPEAITDRSSGRLVAEGDRVAMAAALLDLAADPVQRHRLGTAARAVIEERHNHKFARDTMLRLLGLSSDAATAETPTA